MTSHIPTGVPSLNVYIVQSDTDAAIKWYTENLGAKETLRLPGPGGQGVMHAEIELHGSTLMMSDANADWGTAAPGDLSNFTLTLYVPDCDAVFQQCLNAGAIELDPVTDQFWGDRAGKLRDPFGHCWMIMTHKEDVSNEEMKARYEAWMSQIGSG